MSSVSRTGRIAALLLLFGLIGCTVAQERQAAELPPAPVPRAAQPPSEPPEPAVATAMPVSVRPANEAPAATKIAELYRGTGRSVSQAAAPAARPAGDITLNFEQADLREVVQVILRDILDANYVIDPEVGGTVTIRTGSPITREQVLPILEAVLQANGAVLLNVDGIYRVALAADAGRAGGPLRLRSGEAGYGLQAFPLQYIGAEEMAKVLQPLLPEGAVTSVDGSRNLLLVAGSGSDLRLAADTVRIFDVNMLAGRSVLLESLQNADVGSLVFELDNVFGSKNGPLAGVVRFIPIERLNAVLVIARQPQYLEEARQWIARLDRTRNATTRRLYVYYVQNGKAASIARTLRGIFGGDRGAAPAAIGSVEQTTDGRYSPQRSLLQSEPLPADRGGEAPTAAEPAAAAAGATEGGGGTVTAELAAARRDGTIRIIADEPNNAVLVLATPREYESIEEVLLKLDLVPLQVMIEASILEVTLNDTLRYGVQYFLDTGGLGLTDEGTTILSQTAIGAAGPVVVPGAGFSFILGSAARPKVIVDALSSITEVNVVSTPQVLALDNQPAKLQVGDEVPIITQFAAPISTDARILNQVEYRQTGVTLEVIPRVNASGLVTLEIGQEVSDVTQTTTSGIDSPTIAQRRILSTVAVNSGETVALGGLIRERNSLGNAGIPVLHQLPVIGALFGNRTSTIARTELLVLLTPRVVRSQREARDMTQDLRQKFQAILALQNRGPVITRTPTPP